MHFSEQTGCLTVFCSKLFTTFSHLTAAFYSVIDGNIFEIGEKNQVISVRTSENRQMNTVTPSFNATMRQMT